MNAFGASHKGRWGIAETEVCVKLLYMGDLETQWEFIRKGAIWFGLSHPNVVKMLGGCHVGKPFFVVTELAVQGNFVDYFYRSENKSKMWTLFHQAAQGLSYLHSQRVIHRGLKCSKLLVAENGTAKINDFSLSQVQGQLDKRDWWFGMTIRGSQEPFSRWKAPEWLLEHVAANTSFKLDVYSLGMCIIEAKIGGVPWGMSSEDEIIDQLVSGEGYPCPEGVFTDKEWELVQGMTASDPDGRMTLEEALAAIAELAREEQEIERKWRTTFLGPDVDDLQGVAFDSSKGDLELLSDYTHVIPNVSRAQRQKLRDHVHQVIRWSKEEEEQRTIWDQFRSTTYVCSECGNETPSDSDLCCECGAFNDEHTDREAAFQFVVANRDALQAAITAFEELKVRESVECTKCGQSMPLARFCGECGEHLDPQARIISGNNPAALLNEISRLKVILQHSREHECLLTLKGFQSKLRPCASCGDLNPETDVFCDECGADIEIVRRYKL